MGEGSGEACRAGPGFLLSPLLDSFVYFILTLVFWFLSLEIFCFVSFRFVFPALRPHSSLLKAQTRTRFHVETLGWGDGCDGRALAF